MSHPRSHSSCPRITASTLEVHERNRVSLRLPPVIVVESNECSPVVLVAQANTTCPTLTIAPEIDLGRRPRSVRRGWGKEVGVSTLIVCSDSIRIDACWRDYPGSNELSETVGTVRLHLHHGAALQCYAAVGCCVRDLDPKHHIGA